MRHADSVLVRARIPKDQFEGYLRSGSWTRRDDDVEVKFNPWHDPKTGRFTFKGGGSAPGTWGGGGVTGGGGGSFGGGGASGNWGGPAKTQPGRTGSQPASITSKPSASVVQSIDASTPVGTTVTRNGYTYQIDNAGRTTQVTGTLTLNPNQARSRAAQAAAGGADRLPTDDGGHYVAARFNGPTDSFNHFAQNANFNRGDYRVLENQWATDVKQGDAVWVKIVPGYAGSSQRPSTIKVIFSVNGQVDHASFTNSSSKGKSHGG